MNDKPIHPITAYRAKRALTMEQFARMIGAPKSCVSEWEKWKGPSIRYARKIEALTGGDLTKEAVRPDIWAAAEAAQ